jgi:hypothetical protein
MNLWRIPAPAPCARRSNAEALPGFSKSPETAPTFSLMAKKISLPAVVPMLISESELESKKVAVAFSARYIQ